LQSEQSIDNATINRGTYLTFRRYYFISRLEKTMRLLLKIQSAHRQPFRNFRSDIFDVSMFHDKRIIRSLKRIEELRNLKPLFMIWEDFVAYKSLEDDVFIEDFSKEIFVVTRKVLSSLNEYGNVDHLALHELPHTTPNKTEQLLDAIDQITHALQQIVPPQTAQIRSQLPLHHASPLDLKSEVATDEIALRFYYIQRLQKAIELLRKTPNDKPYHTIDYQAFSKSGGVATVLRAMQETSSPNPMMHQWDDMKEYKFIDNIKFVKEFASVVFIALRHVYTNPGGSLFDETHIENMSIDQILHAIDIITDQVSNSSQAYTTGESSTFQEWFDQYWWAIPLTIGTIAVRLAYYYYHSTHSYGYFGGSFGGSFGGFGGSHYGSSNSAQSDLNF
jgi:hypothetical protein